MPKLSIEDLRKIEEKARQAVTLRSGKAGVKVTIHMGTCGIAAGARDIMTALLKQIEAYGATDIIVAASGCGGQCSHEPMAVIELQGRAPVRYGDLTPEKMKRLFKEHVLDGRPVREFVLGSDSETAGRGGERRP